MDDQDDDRSARAPEPDDVLRICQALNESGARYLLIGGFAVIAHGAGRFTKDIGERLSSYRGGPDLGSADSSPIWRSALARSWRFRASSAFLSRGNTSSTLR